MPLFRVLYFLKMVASKPKVVFDWLFNGHLNGLEDLGGVKC